MRWFLFQSFIFLLLLAPLSAGAQDTGPLVACGGVDCDFCLFIDSVIRVISFVTGIAVIIATLILAYGGYRLVSSKGDPGVIKDSKDKIVNSVIGIVIIMVAFTLVDALVKVTVNQGIFTDGGRWFVPVECGGSFNEKLGGSDIDLDLEDVSFVLGETAAEPAGALTQTIMYSVPGTPVTAPVPTGDPSIAGEGLSDADAKAYLDGAGIEYKSSVSGEGVKPHVVAQLISLEQECGCDITVTSLTDGNHAAGTFSHGSGYKADLRSTGGGDPNPELVAYVQSLPSAGSWNDGTPLYYDPVSCGVYAIEDDHIDVQYKTGC